MQSWSPSSWQHFSCQQAILYPDAQHLNTVIQQLHELPPLVTPHEINHLKKAIRLAGRGEAFILQGGDCAESFYDCRPDIIANKLKIILQMGFILQQGLHKPIIRVGRIAGQYAKPRTSDFETKDGTTLPSYRGDLINVSSFDAISRKPNPELMLQAYYHSAMTLNYIRALSKDGFSDLHQPFQGEDFYTSHEALNLYFEQALTHQVSQDKYYNLSTHFPWIGMRTTQANSAHLEFIRGIENPIGIKIGPSAHVDWLLDLLELLNPKREEGRLVLITRFGAKNIRSMLPPLILAIKASKMPVTWSCDPMHGNTEMIEDGTKTRHFNTILSELQQAISIHQQCSSYLGGVHFELTGEPVTECIGGARNLNKEDLKRAYRSLIDPRLNYEQSLEIALRLVRHSKAACVSV